jgi:hypothetical protein
MNPRLAYPVGETWIYDIGVAQVAQHYPAPDRMHYRVLTGPRAGAEESLAIEIRLIRPDVFLVSWREADGITVVHVEDFATHVFHSCVTLPDGGFRRHSGSMWPQSA